MTTKEIEELTGMTRANIRFYEAEGFITPAKSANGYRDYSLQDSDILKKIKLLRSLHISLEEIKNLHAGSHNLSDTLEEHIIRLSAQKADLDSAQKICSSIKQDGVTYQSLNAEKYLNTFSNLAEASPDELSQDTIPPVRSPWRRFFARALDEVLYACIWNMILIIGFRVNIANLGNAGTILDTVITLILTIFLEPLQLSLFGTTVGKSILGLSVRDNNDRKLTYGEAQTRTIQVLWHGCGFQLPIYNLYRNWKSYNTCLYYDTLPWEYDNTLILKDEKPWRTAVYIGVRVTFFITLLVTVLLVQRPPVRGDLTVPEFCRNYRYLEEYYDLGGSKQLNDIGEWQQKKASGNDVVIYVFEDTFDIEEKQNFQFELTEDGYIESVSFLLEYSSKASDSKDPSWMPSCQEQMQLATLAFVGAQDSFQHLSNDRQVMLKQISSHPFKDFQFTEAGITVTCDVESSGYSASTLNYLIPQEDTDTSFYLHFTMQKK